MNLAQPVLGLAADGAVVTRADRHQPFADVAAGTHVHAQAVARVLHDHAPVGAQQQAALRLGERIDIGQPAAAQVVLDNAVGRR
jgi:hypothetical protein